MIFNDSLGDSSALCGYPTHEIAAALARAGAKRSAGRDGGSNNRYTRRPAAPAAGERWRYAHRETSRGGGLQRSASPRASG